MRRVSVTWPVRHRILSFVTAILVVFVPVALEVHADPGNGGPPWSGEDLFRGLLLGQGPVAALFPEIWDEVNDYRTKSIPAEKLEEAEAAIEYNTNKVMEYILADDHEYFENFAVEVQSGDQLRVEAAILDGADRLIDVIALLADMDSEQLQTFDIPQVPLVGVAAVVVVAAVLVVVSLGVLFMQVAAAVWAVSIVAIFHFTAAVQTQVGVVHHHNFAPAESSLAREVWVDMMTTRLEN